MLRRKVKSAERKGSRWIWENRCEGNISWPSATRMRDHKLEGPECPGASNSSCCGLGACCKVNWACKASYTRDLCIVCVCVYTPLIDLNPDDLEQRNSLCCSCWDESCAEKDMPFCPCCSVHPAMLVLCICLCWDSVLSLAAGWTWHRRSSPGLVRPHIQLPLVRCNLTLPREVQNRRMAPGQAIHPSKEFPKPHVTCGMGFIIYIQLLFKNS